MCTAWPITFAHCTSNTQPSVLCLMSLLLSHYGCHKHLWISPVISCNSWTNQSPSCSKGYKGTLAPPPPSACTHAFCVATGVLKLSCVCVYRDGSGAGSCARGQQHPRDSDSQSVLLHVVQSGTASQGVPSMCCSRLKCVDDWLYWFHLDDCSQSRLNDMPYWCWQLWLQHASTPLQKRCVPIQSFLSLHSNFFAE